MRLVHLRCSRALLAPTQYQMDLDIVMLFASSWRYLAHLLWMPFSPVCPVTSILLLSSLFTICSSAWFVDMQLKLWFGVLSTTKSLSHSDVNCHEFEIHVWAATWNQDTVAMRRRLKLFSRSALSRRSSELVSVWKGFGVISINLATLFHSFVRCAEMFLLYCCRNVCSSCRSFWLLSINHLVSCYDDRCRMRYFPCVLIQDWKESNQLRTSASITDFIPCIPLAYCFPWSICSAVAAAYMSEYVCKGHKTCVPIDRSERCDLGMWIPPTRVVTFRCKVMGYIYSSSCVFACQPWLAYGNAQVNIRTESSVTDLRSIENYASGA